MTFSRPLWLTLCCSLTLSQLAFAGSRDRRARRERAQQASAASTVASPSPATTEPESAREPEAPQDFQQVCQQLLSTFAKDIRQFTSQASEYMKQQLAERNVYPDELARVESVASIGDAVLVRQAGVLKLVKMKGLSPADSNTASLEGSFIEGWKTGDFYFVRTRLSKAEQQAGSQEDFNQVIYIVAEDLKAKRSLRLPPGSNPRRIPLEKQHGEAILVANYLWIVARTKSNERRESQFAHLQSTSYVFREISFEHPITAFNLELPQDLPFARIDYGHGQAARAYYLDLELQGQIHTPKILDVPASAHLEWRNQIGGRDQDFLVNASWRERGENEKFFMHGLKNADGTRVLQILTVPKRYRNSDSLIFKTELEGENLDLTRISGSRQHGNDGSMLLYSAGKKTRLGKQGILPILFNGASSTTLEEAEDNSRFHIIENDPDRVIPRLTKGKSTVNGTTEQKLEYTIIRDDPEQQTPFYLRFFSESRWRDFATTDMTLPGFPKDTVYASIYRGSRAPTQAIIKTKGELTALLIPGYRKYKEAKTRSNHIYMYFGKSEDEKQIKRYLVIYDSTKDKFLFGTGSEVKSVGDSSVPYLDADREILRAAQPVAFKEDLDDLITEVEDNHILWVRGTAEGPESLKMALRIDVESRSVQIFQDYQKLKVKMPKDVPPEIRHAQVFAERRQQRQDAKLKESTILTVLSSEGEMEDKIQVEGEITNLRLESIAGQGGRQTSFKYVANGEVRLISRTIPTEVHWTLGQGKYAVQRTNLRPQPIFSNSRIKFLVSDAYNTVPPKIYYVDKETTDPEEIPLSFALNTKSPEKMSLIELLRFIFGIKDEDQTPVNQSEIESVMPDQNDSDLFFIRTVADAHSSSKTYVWSLREHRLVFAISNLVGFKDIGLFRFYFGQATPLNNSTVIVFDRKNHQFITYFDFRKLRLAVNAENFIKTDPERRQISFLTEGGLTRVFDEQQNSFIGLLPEKVLSKLEGFERDLGTILNQTVFMQAVDPLFERDDFIHRLADGLVPADSDRVLQNSLVVTSPGAGIDHTMQDFMNRWISGQLPQSKNARIVFLRLEQGRLASGTMYRGQTADKFNSFRTKALALKQMGYQIVLMIEKLETLDETPHNFGEGDLFQNVYSLVRDDIVTVLASVTPGGYDILTRKQGAFMGLFKNRVNLDPMGVDSTRVAIKGYLKANNQQERLAERQVNTIISQVRRLNKHKVLPGSAFAVVKALPLRDGTRGMLADRQVQEGLARISGLPSFLLDSANFELHEKRMLEYMNRRVVDQPEVIGKLVDSLFAFAQNSNRSDLPIARMLLPGLTGTGKTEVARALVEYLFKDVGALLKIDGAAYSGNQDPLGLAEVIAAHIRKYPFNILLMDELEKMHPQARDVILSVADGSVTDRYGERVSTALTILIATTNAGSEKAKFYMRANFDRPTEILNDGLRRIFEDATYLEFSGPQMGRFDVVYPFRILSDEKTHGLVKDYLTAEVQLATESIYTRYRIKGIELEFDANALRLITASSVDRELGARRLTNNVEQLFLKEFLAPAERRGKLKPGNAYVIGARDFEYTITRKAK